MTSVTIRIPKDVIEDLWDDLAAAPSEVPVHERHKEYRMDSGNVVFVAKKKKILCHNNYIMLIMWAI
jgi:hypothetical protein